MNRFALTFALLFPIASIALAGKIKTWTAATPAHWEKATFQNAVVSSEGVLRLGRQLQPLDVAIDAARVWDVVEDPHGNLFVATGDAGKIYKIAADGKVTVAFDSQDTQVLCLLATADGNVYAGTGPSGLIVRIDPTGNANILHDSPENYIWALTYDEATRNVFAATGPHGRIYQIDAAGKASLFFQSKQDHILCLARASVGTLFAGTDKHGLVYEIDKQGRGRVLFQAAQAEVRCLHWTEQALYAGTSSPPGSRVPSPPTNGGVVPGRVASLARPEPDEARSPYNPRVPVATPVAIEKPRDSEKGNPAPAPSAPSSGENSVYRIGFNGSVREVFRDKALVLSFLPHGGKMFVGTGVKGQLFEISPQSRERSELARLDSGQLQKLVVRKDGSIVVAAADPGRLYLLRDRFEAKGTVTSDVIDAKLTSRWGTLAWQADMPTGTQLSVAARSGNVSEPDETWSPWGAEQTDPQKAVAAVPTGRYLQLRISMQTNNAAATPALHNVSVRYATLNQAPEVTALEIPNLDAPGTKEKKYRFKWTATDANEDELAFDLFVRKSGWREWVKVEESWTKIEYEWDATTVPSGNYQWKVVASDRADNALAEAFSTERTSLPFVVAHEPPAVKLKVVGIEKNRAVLEAEATSEFARLASATFALDSGKWTKAFPADGLFDGTRKTFRFQSDLLQAGTHVVVLRVQDAAGNIGSADVVFEVQPAGK